MRPLLVVAVLAAGCTQPRHAPPPPKPAAPALAPGLVVEFFDIGEELEDFPDVAERQPTVRRVDGQIDYEATEEGFAGTDLADFFYVRWTGVIRVPKDGRVRFTTDSDDGSRLFVDGQLVVDNGGLHPMEEQSGEIELKAGDHEFKVDLFENGGGVGCRVYWQATGGAREIIPEAVLFHRKP